MPLDTLIFDPSACHFPRPRIPLLATGLDGLALKPPARWAPAANFRHFTRGRYALREAYRLAGIGPGGTLLAPAYHCRTILDPALALGGDVLLYPLQADLSADPAALDALAGSAAAPVKALLVTHFFGRPQPLAQLVAWCGERNITLIEDCSHALFCEHHRPPGIGRSGAFVVSSPYKFLPCPDGGLLYSADPSGLADVATRPAAPSAELRGLASLPQRHRSQTTCVPARLDAELAVIASRPMPKAAERRESAGCSNDYHNENEGLAALRSSLLIYRHPDSTGIARRRRENYQRWAATTTNLPHCRPLFPDLPEGCIPYMFPLRIEQPDPHFYRLKHLGVPIWRWDSIAVSACPVASDYRLHLLHLPCHQSLNESQMDWMIAAVQKLGADKTAESAR